MCGISGFLEFDGLDESSDETIRQMLASIRHRGPDEFGVYLDDTVALGNARLSIVDLEGGQQPFSAADERFWIVYNGEIFNHIELRQNLELQGERFESHCDTEVVLRLFAVEGPSCLKRLNGQFAIAIWDSQKRELFLARDRLGIRPLYYHRSGTSFIFGSEIKAIAAHPSVSLAIDPIALGEVFTRWSTVSPRSPFVGIESLEPGSCAIVSARGIQIQRYWELEFDNNSNGAERRGDDDWIEEFRWLLNDSTRIRLNSDVPVGSYLSGGLDSSIVASLAKKLVGDRLDTFSIAFTDGRFDEREAQEQMAKHIGTRHQVVQASHSDIAEVFPEVVWHVETPLLRTAPAPMFLLSKLVRENGYKVVLTGEGADEFLAGYDIFKETLIRRFWSRNPESAWRSSLFQRIYPDLGNLSRVSPKYLASFFGERLADTDTADYSHLIRWKNTKRTHRFFSNKIASKIQVDSGSQSERLGLPKSFAGWSPLARAQFMEIKTFMSPYLLAAQGDRVAMANSVEGRYPFLDYRVVEFCNRLPQRLKLRGLQDKRILRRLGSEFLPENIWKRPKKPYRAPIHKSFLGGATPDYVTELVSESKVSDYGYFNPVAVSKLVAKIGNGGSVGEVDDMALVGIISTQVLHQQFVERFPTSFDSLDKEQIKVCDRRASVCRK